MALREDRQTWGSTLSLDGLSRQPRWIWSYWRRLWGSARPRRGERRGLHGGGRRDDGGLPVSGLRQGREPAAPQSPHSSRADVCFPEPLERRWCVQGEERKMPLTSRWGMLASSEAWSEECDGQGLRFRFQR